MAALATNLTYAYCDAVCQREDWAAHKLDCDALAAMHARTVEANVAGKAGGQPIGNKKFLLEWYANNTGGDGVAQAETR
jgi:hypothetical protein